MSTRKDYVIRISPAVPPSYLSLVSDEWGDSNGPARTTDPELALRFTNFAEARTELRAQVKRWHRLQFKLDVAEQLEAQEGRADPATSEVDDIAARAELVIEGIAAWNRRAAPAVQAGGEPTGWRPIATAPKDGRLILLGRMEGDEITQSAEMQWSHIQWSGLLPGAAGMWASPGGNLTWSAEPSEFGPTHWMPFAMDVPGDTQGTADGRARHVAKDGARTLR